MVCFRQFRQEQPCVTFKFSSSMSISTVPSSLSFIRTICRDWEWTRKRKPRPWCNTGLLSAVNIRDYGSRDGTIFLEAEFLFPKYHNILCPCSSYKSLKAAWLSFSVQLQKVVTWLRLLANVMTFRGGGEGGVNLCSLFTSPKIEKKSVQSTN